SMIKTKQKASHRKRKATIRAVSGRPWPADAHDKRLRDALAQELIGVCVEGLKTFGLDGRRLATLAVQARASASKRISSASQVLTDAEQLGHAISKWAEEPGYSDSTGRPAVLSVRDSG